MPRKKKRKKLPHGMGSITELSKNRNKRFWARKKAILLPDGTLKRESLGFFETYEEAYQALLTPGRYSNNKVTFEEVFNNYIKSTSFKILKPDTKSRYISDFEKLGDLRYESIQDTNFSMLQEAFDRISENGYIKNDKKYKYSMDKLKKIKTVVNKIYIRAIQDGIVDVNLSEHIELNGVQNEKAFNPFILEEINKMFELKDQYKELRYILVHIFTGFRTIEMVNFKKEHIDLEKKTARGMGAKTKTGKTRTIILHDKIMPIIKELYSETNDYMLGEKISTKVYRERIFKNTLSEISILNNRTPYDCRDTFAYLMNHYKVDRETIKQMMGHNDYATTSNNYISFDYEKAKKELNKIVI